MENSKIMGEVGALLMLASPLAGAYTAVLGLVGFVLLIVALDGLADHYRERAIFKDALKGGLVLIAGAVLAAAVMVVAAIALLTVMGIPESSWADPAAWQAVDWEGFSNWAAMAPLIGVMALAMVALFALSVYAATLVRRSLSTLAQRSGVAMFATSGTLLLVGAVLSIIGIGVVLLWIALLLLAVAFFRLRVEPAQITPIPSV